MIFMEKKEKSGRFGNFWLKIRKNQRIFEGVVARILEYRVFFLK
jgi:hypothetical protein